MPQEILKPLNALLVDRSGELEAFITNSVDVPIMDVVVVNDSNAMRKRLERTQPDVIFFSPDFAETGLLDFCRSFRKTSQGAYTYLILFLDKSKKDFLARAFEAGIDEFITVPFITAELLAKVKLLVRMKNMGLDQIEMRNNVIVNGQAVVAHNNQLKERILALEQELDMGNAAARQQEALAKKWEGEALGLRRQVEQKSQEAVEIKHSLGDKDQWQAKAMTLMEEVSQLRQQARHKDDALVKLRVEIAERKKGGPPLFLDGKDKSALESSESAMDELDRVNRLRKYLSPVVVEKIITADAAKPFGSVAKRRHATFMFVDVRDLTQFADDLEPKLLTQLITETFNHIMESITNFGGTVNKFLGDSLLAIFNDPVPVKDHAMRAMQAAVRVKHLAKHHQDRPGLLRSPFLVAITVHTGEAVFGNFGTHQQIDYTAVGRDITLAARLLGFSLDNEIIVTKGTYESVLPHVTVKNERQASIKGFEEPIWIGDLDAVLR